MSTIRMIRKFFKKILFLSRTLGLVLLILATYFIYNTYRSYQEDKRLLSIQLDLFKKEGDLSLNRNESWIQANCLCKDNEGNEFNFCYRLPETGRVGKRFSCQYLEHLKTLGLLSDSATIDLSNQKILTPIFVTALSQNHWDEAKRLLASIRQHWRHQRVIVYDLGLSSSTAQFVRDLCNVELRQLNFAQYPEYVQELAEYRWKPLLIAETLNEFGAIWYMDSSIVWKTDDLTPIYDLLNCRSGGSQSLQSITDSVRDQRENVSSLERWRNNVKECQKSAYLFHSSGGHGIYSTTSPHLYEWIPTNINKILKTEMFQAGFIFAVKTDEVVDRILRWYVLCALEDTCMAPREFRRVSLYCQWGESAFTDFANCHRFDQSVVNLLSANAFNYDPHYYFSEIDDFFEVIRRTDMEWIPDYSCTEKKP